MRIVFACIAVVVIQVPVYTSMMRGTFENKICDIISHELTISPSNSALRDVGAVQHSIVPSGGANEGDVIGFVRSVEFTHRL